jgi:hypothetical protein
MFFDPEKWTPSAILILAVLLLAIGGGVVDFIPAEGLYGRNTAIAFWFIGLALGVLICRLMLANELLVVGTPFLKAFWEAGWKTWLGVFSIPFVLGVLAWLILARLVPWSLTNTFGVDRQMQVSMQARYRFSTKRCNYRLESGPLSKAAPSHVCISSDYYYRHPDRTVTVEFKGKESFLGFSWSSMNHVSSTDDDDVD